MSTKDQFDADVGDAHALGKAPSQPNGPGGSDDGEVSEIRQSIEQTRSDMSETIDELQERLSPSHLKEQVKEQVMEQYRQARDSVREATIGKVEDMVERVSDTMYETRRSFVDTVAANPIPSAMVGIGLAWLWMNRRSSRGTNFAYGNDYRRVPRNEYGTSRYAGGRPADDAGRWDETSDRYADSTRDLAGKAGQAVSDVAARVQGSASNLGVKAKETVSGAMDKAQQTAGYVTDQARYQARRAEQSFNAAMEQSPLAVGAVALALGTAVGLVVPSTRKEDEWMGEARDTVLEKAQSVASEALDKVQEVASTATDQMASSTERQGGQASSAF